MQIPELREPVRDGGDREVLRVRVVDLVPGDRGGDRGFWNPADGVGARDRVVAGVLVVVDEDLLRVAVLPPPGGGGVPGAATLHLARERERSPPHLVEPPARLDPDVDVKARAAGGLGPAHGADLVEYLASHVSHATHAVEAALRHRVEID